MTSEGMALTVSNLSCGYGSLTVIRSANLVVRQGECLAIFGPNGAGKTTLLRALSGQAAISEGRVAAFGVSLRGRPAWQVTRLGVVHVPEGRRMFQGMSVYDNLRVACREDRRTVAERLEEVLELFPVLGARLRQRTETLSGGEQQMAAIARGLMAGPKLLLLDEPSQGLAPLVVEQVMDGIRRFVADKSRTVIIVEQRPEFLQGMIDVAVVMAGGEVSRSLTEEEVLRGRALSECLLTGRLGASLLGDPHPAETEGGGLGSIGIHAVGLEGQDT